MSRPSNSNDPPTKPRAFTGPPIKRVLFTMAALALGYVVLLAYLNYQSRAKVARVFGGARGASILKHADGVEAYRIGQVPDIIDKWPDLALNDHPIEKGPLAVSQADVETLVTTLLDEKSYVWDAAKACIPQPGVRIDFIRGNDRLSVLLCFECNIVETYLNEKFAGGEDFDFAQPTLVRIVHTLFPNDPKIQSLKAEEFTPPNTTK